MKKKLVDIMKYYYITSVTKQYILLIYLFILLVYLFIFSYLFYYLFILDFF